MAANFSEFLGLFSGGVVVGVPKITIWCGIGDKKIFNAN